MYHTICVNYEAKINAGAGAGPNGRLRLQPNPPAPAPKPCLQYIHSTHQNRSFSIPQTPLRKKITHFEGLARKI